MRERRNKMAEMKSELYALLIGIDCYLPNSLPGGYCYKSLGGCVRDTKHVEAFLISRMGLKPEKILKLTSSCGNGSRPKEPQEQWPTYENIIAKFKEVHAAAQVGDQVYIHYSGHGGRTTTAYKDLKGSDGLDEALVPNDIGNSEARYVRDVELAYLLKEMVDNGLLVTVVLDSCHSGGATRGVGKGMPRTMSPDGYGFDKTPRPTSSDVASYNELVAAWRGLYGHTRAAKPASGWMAEPKGYTLLAACRANEYAYEDYFNGNEKSGALTYWLIDSLRSSGGSISYKMIHERILARIRSWAVEQTPQLQGEGDRAVFGSERISPHYAILVMQVDKDRKRIALNAGESHGLRVGDLLAVYPPSYPNLDSNEGRQALASISEVIGDSDSWAIITENYGNTTVESGAQAVFLGSTDVRFQRTIGLALDDASLKKTMKAAISKGGAGFIRLAGEEESIDLQVALNDTGDFYEIWDRNGTEIPNLRPPIRTSETNAAEKIADRLVHLAKYLNVQALQNPDPSTSQMFRLELIDSPIGGESGRTPIYGPGTIVTLRVYNNLQPNSRDINDPTRILNVTVLDLQPDWGISQLFPSGAGLSEIVQPGKFIDVRLKTELPEGYNEATDVLKVFATQKTTSFRWMELPVLDEPSYPRKATRSAITDPLEQFISYLTDDNAPPRDEIRTRAVKLLSESGTQKTWSVAQVEVSVKNA